MVCLREEDQRLKYRSHHVIARVRAINTTYHCWCRPWSLAEGSVCQVPALYSYSLYPLSVLYSLALSDYGQTTFKEWGVKICILKRWSAYINYLEFLSMKDLPFLSPLFIYSIIYASADSWVFILYPELQSNATLLILFLKLFQLWPLGSHSVRSSPFDGSPSLWFYFISFLDHFLTFWHHKMF